MKKFVSIILILVLVFSMSCFALADNVSSPEASNTPTTSTPSSPQTGDTISVAWVVVIAAAAVAALAFCGKKLISEK